MADFLFGLLAGIAMTLLVMAPMFHRRDNAAPPVEQTTPDVEPPVAVAESKPVQMYYHPVTRRPERR